MCDLADLSRLPKNLKPEIAERVAKHCCCSLIWQKMRNQDNSCLRNLILWYNVDRQLYRPGAERYNVRKGQMLTSLP